MVTAAGAGGKPSAVQAGHARSGLGPAPTRPPGALSLPSKGVHCERRRAASLGAGQPWAAAAAAPAGLQGCWHVARALTLVARPLPILQGVPLEHDLHKTMTMYVTMTTGGVESCACVATLEVGRLWRAAPRAALSGHQWGRQMCRCSHGPMGQATSLALDRQPVHRCERGRWESCQRGGRERSGPAGQSGRSTQQTKQQARFAHHQPAEGAARAGSTGRALVQYGSTNSRLSSEEPRPMPSSSSSFWGAAFAAKASTPSWMAQHAADRPK